MDGKLKYTNEYEGEELTLRDCVELYALEVCNNLAHGKGGKEIMLSCKILDTLSNALTSVNSY